MEPSIAPTSCCHQSAAIHIAEVTLLASLIVEHLVSANQPDVPLGRTAEFRNAHQTAANALGMWRAAVALS